MKAILKYNLPEDKKEFNVACKGSDLFLSLWDFDQQLRQYIKHGHNFKDVDEALETMRNWLYGCMSNHDVDFDMMS